MTHYGIRDEYAPTFGRQHLTIWSGAFASDLDGYADELPNHDGYMLRAYYGQTTLRVECPAPRTDDNWSEVDDALREGFARLVEQDKIARTPVHTFADGWGRWYAEVVDSGDERDNQRRALAAIRDEMAQREGSAFDARSIRVDWTCKVSRPNGTRMVQYAERVPAE